MTEENAKLRHIWFNRVKSNTGFVVKIRIFEGYCEYREHNRIATIPVELVIGQALAHLSKDAAIKWKPPFENEEISEDKRKEILKNTAEAMRFRGCPTEIV
jgi:hypothetical protein